MEEENISDNSQHSHEEEDDEEIEWGHLKNKDEIMDEADSDVEGGNLNAWGNKKEDYYQEDEGSDTDRELEEEKEANEILTRNQALLEEDHFFNANQTTSSSAKKLHGMGDDDHEFTVDISKKKANFVQELAGLSSFEDKLQKLTETNPELLNIIKEYQDSLTKLKETFLPAFEVLKQEKFAKNDAYKYVELKSQILASYCLTLSFFLKLKSQGKVVESSHPVIAKIIDIKRKLAKFKPLDKKLAPKIKEIIAKGIRTDIKAASPSSKTDGLLLLNKLDLLKKSSPSPKESTPKHNAKNQVKSKLSNKISGVMKRQKQDEMRDEEEDKRFGVKKTNGSKKKASALNNKFEDSDSMGEDGDMDSEMEQEGPPLGMPNMADSSSDDDSDDSDLNYYNKVKTSKKAKRERRLKKAHEEADYEPDDQILVNKDALRTINYKILRNKGLIRKRKKIDRNSRTKLKEKFRKAMIKQKSKGIFHKEAHGVYGGEETGIKSNIIKGVSLMQK